MELQQSQVQRLSQQQLHGLELLQLSTLELDDFIRELTMENPLVEPEELTPAPDQDSQNEFLSKLRWLEDNDYQNRFYQHIDREGLDPLANISDGGGLEETLFRFLSRQINRLDLSENTAQVVRYLAACLDDNGYLRISLDELSLASHISVPHLEEGLRILRTLEPAGVGASDLPQCLALQLRRIHNFGPALTIVQDYLEMLAKRHYHGIMEKTGFSMETILAAEKTIQELEPRPGAAFQQAEQIPYILPDIFVEEADGRFFAHSRRKEHAPFHINAYYLNLLESTPDKEVQSYLNGKLRQAEGILFAIDQRESTLQRCAQAIVNHQTEFFRNGPQFLQSLRMADVAGELNLHESTISRAAREKYLQCTWGVYPLSYFFSRSCVAEGGEHSLGGSAARTLLRALIDAEDKAHPLSDQKLSERMAEQNCPISRRTVAKYREELNIPGVSGRKLR